MKSVPRSLALCLALALGLALFPIFPATTLAASTVIVGDTDVTVGSETMWTTNGSSTLTGGATDANYNVKYENGVLTLRGANITGVDTTTYGAAIYADGDLTIVLEATASVLEGLGNKPPVTGGVFGSAGIYVDGKLTIEGAGDLTSKSDPSYNGNSYGVWAKDVELKSGALSGETTRQNIITGTRWGVYAENSITVSGGDLTGKNPDAIGESATYRNYGVFAGTSINMTGGTLTGQAGRADVGSSYGVAVDNGSIEVYGGALTGTAKKGSMSYGVRGNSVTVFGGTLSGTGGDSPGGSYGVYTDPFANNCLVSGGTLTGHSDHPGGGTAPKQAFNKAPVIGSGYLTPQVAYGNSSSGINGTGSNQATVDNHYTERYLSIVSGPYTSQAAVGGAGEANIPKTGDNAMPG
ncbi:MAG: hypothetical protein Q4B48_08770, partial [Syntrophomonadaceae bacterium]|nr:hypothetical protein [Syntrophomonadaceae bacterium]